MKQEIGKGRRNEKKESEKKREEETGNEFRPYSQGM